MHTPGKWTVKKAQFHTVIEAEGDEYYICSMIEDNKSWRANANLIAAAPALLEACKEAVYFILNIPPEVRANLIYDGTLEFEKLERAIAKVEESRRKFKEE